MAMNQAPTLILGIGGIGCRIAAGISDLLSPEDRAHIGIVGMDTNINDLNKLAQHNMVTVQTSDERTVGDYLRMHPEYTTWFPVNRFTVSRGMLNGAGQIRAISRLAALAAMENGRFVPIKEEISRIRSNTGGNNCGTLTVMVVGSITGGTGAGLFLQMPYYIRSIMRDEAGLNSIIIRGMFVGPDLTADVQPSNINKDAVRVNAYACLKELNAVYMSQATDVGEGKLKVDFYTPTDPQTARDVAQDMRRTVDYEGFSLEDDFDLESFSDDADVISLGNPDLPYDYLYLIEGTTAQGDIGNTALSNVEQQVARMVHTLMFTPVKDNALSVEDNLVLQDMETGGMNRYSSAGLCRLVYPVEQAKEYVTLCTARDLVKDEWLLLDDSYRDEVAEARSRQATDGKVEIPQIEQSYVDLFARQVKGNGRLGRLYSEAYVVVEREPVSRAVGYLAGIDDCIAEILDSDDVVEAINASTMNDENMKTFAEAKKEISRLYTGLEDFAKLATQLINDKAAAIANELFPPSWQSMQHRKDAANNIYQLLHGVHPITARFLCYDMILQLRSQIAELQGQVAGIDLDNYLEEDFDTKEPGVQSADTALKNLSEKQIPVIGAIGGEAGKLKKLKRMVQDSTDGQRELILQYLRQSLGLAASQILLKRLEQLAQNYYVFFQSIDTMIRENNDRIRKLEALRMPFGQLGIYCSREAFRIMAARYRNIASNDLPVETKTVIFEELFRVLSDDFDFESQVTTERQKEQRAAEKRVALGGIFRTNVLDSLRTDVVKRGADIVDMTILQALEAQFELDPGDTIRALNLPREEKLQRFIREKIEQGMRMAAPMLATSADTLAENTETVYLAMNPKCAATEMGAPNVGATKDMYIPQACAATDGVQATVLMEEEFSPYEFTCFKARYKFSIEDLVKYGPTSLNARCYQTRLSNLGRAPANPNDPEAFKTVVNPHLDRYWHEEAYLPAISANERLREHKATLKAFIYAMGLDCFKRMVDESTLDTQGNARELWYIQTAKGFQPVKVRGSYIGKSYTDLYKSLYFNGKIKKYILRLAEQTLKVKKGYSVPEELEETILEDWFIEDLIQSVPDRDGEPDENLLDIILRMRDNMPESQWKELFTGLQEVLWEFCAYLFDNNQRMVNNAVRSILDKMLEYSKVGRKSADSLTYAERELRAQVANLRNTVYSGK